MPSNLDYNVWNVMIVKSSWIRKCSSDSKDKPYKYDYKRVKSYLINEQDCVVANEKLRVKGRKNLPYGS
ncbi:Hypothetical predicted protein [Octopus vulgaris]|uniref:Uncharacterized protein n=1 Tax=Octopus vulgaris TaxID=6645 RepID=A0AA36FJD2_OCTVU|nr:Hypothetical predicted protein [Octopus vulgaris]